MSKTPVSTLQELMAKQNFSLPIYDLIEEKCLPSPSFTYRVKCNLQTATGSATSKKEAKHNAAKAMLKMLSGTNNNVAMVSDKSTTVETSNIPVDSYYLSNVASISHDDIFVNFVGKLYEYCQTFHFETPEYTDDNVIGPDHLREFTVKCSSGSLSAKGTANTKKKAKQEAAQNLHQMLLKMSSKSKADLLHDKCKGYNPLEEAEEKFLTLRIDEQKWLDAAVSSDKAKKLFPKLTVNKCIGITKNIDVKDYHEALKNSICSEERAKVKMVLNTETGTFSMIKSKHQILDTVLRLLDLQIEWTNAEKINDEFIIYCTLNSIPVIMDMGLSKTVNEAKEIALSNLLTSIDLLLK